MDEQSDIQGGGNLPKHAMKHSRSESHGALVGDGDHAHPAAQHAQVVDDIKGLRPAIDLPKFIATTL